MKKLILSFTLLLFFLLLSCKENVKKEETTTEETQINKTEANEIPEFTEEIEATHKKSDFLAKEIISYDLVVKFGGKESLNAKYTQSVDGTLIKMERANGEIVIYNGKEVYTNKADTDLGKDRFDIFTWSYFVTIPYKLNDEGTIWSDFHDRPFYGETVPTGKLTFENNIGDAPDDWYVVYKNPKNYLVGTAYIVTFGKDKKASKIEPHAVKYTNFSEVDGIPFAKNWTYHLWTNENGFGDQIGEATLTNVTFSKSNDTLFKKPENATLVPLK